MLDKCPNCNKLWSIKVRSDRGDCFDCRIGGWWGDNWWICDKKLGDLQIRWFSDGKTHIWRNDKGIIKDMPLNYHLPYDIDKARIEKLLLLA